MTNFEWRKKNVKNQRQNKSHYHFHHAVNYFDGFLYQSGLPINIGHGLVVISSFCWHINHFHFSVFYYIISMYRPFQFVIRLYTNDDFRKYSKLWYVVTHIRSVLFSTVVMIASPHWCDPFFYLVLSIHRHLFIDSRSSHWYGWYLRRLENNDHFFSLFNRCDVRIIHFK